MPGPITPSEAIEKKQQIVPEFVFEAFNELIARNLSGGYATVKQDDVVALILKKMNSVSVTWEGMGEDRARIFDEHWLDIEPLYKKAGWVVKYDSPGYNETYAATFTFKKKS